MAATKYQMQARREGRRAFEQGQDLLVVIPTGGGKSATMAWLAQDELGRLEALNGVPARALYLTHRRKLFLQLAGDPDGVDQAAQAGEISNWAEENVGQIADKGLGGINEGPRHVVGMVETVRRRLANNPNALKDYDLIFIDECQHTRDSASGFGEDEPLAPGAYDEVIQALMARNPNLRIAGFTGTDFRSDVDETLHPRLETARRFRVTYQDVLAEKRIVPPKTLRPAYRHKNGLTVEQMAKDLLEKGGPDRLAAEMGPLLSKQRGDDFWDEMALYWSVETPGKKTICFTDTVEEAELLTAAFERLGRDRPDLVRGVGLVSSHQSEKDNRAVFKGFGAANGPINIVVSCKMIGEGYNVPDTEVVLITNRLTTRGWYAQMIGRNLRQNIDGTKQFGHVLDGGASSYLWGTLEQQIAFEPGEVLLSAADDEVSRAAAIARLWLSTTDKNGEDWHVFPSDKKTLFAHERADGQFDVFERAVGQKAGASKSGAAVRVQRAKNSAGAGDWSMEDLIAVTRTQHREKWGWHAVLRAAPANDPAEGSAWLERATRDFNANCDSLALYMQTAAPVAKAAEEAGDGKRLTRTENMQKLMRHAREGTEVAEKVNGWFGKLATDNASLAGRREVLRLVGVAFESAATTEFGLGAEGRSACRGAALAIAKGFANGARPQEQQVQKMLLGAERVLKTLQSEATLGNNTSLANTATALSAGVASALTLAPPLRAAKVAAAG